MPTLLRLALAAAGSMGLYSLAEMLAGSYSAVPHLYDAPLTALAGVFVVLFLALGVFDAAREWNPGWKRIGIIAAGALVLLSLPNWSGRGVFMPVYVPDKAWRIIATIALPAAALTVWGWFMRSQDDGAFSGASIGAVADTLEPRRILFALGFGMVLPLVFLTLREEIFRIRLHGRALPVAAMVVTATAVIYMLPGALRFLSGMALRTRRAVLLCSIGFAAVCTILMGMSIEDWSFVMVFDALIMPWVFVVVAALGLSAVYLISRTGGWASAGFADAGPAKPPQVREDEPAGVAKRESGITARRRAGSTRSK